MLKMQNDLDYKIQKLSIWKKKPEKKKLVKKLTEPHGPVRQQEQ